MKVSKFDSADVAVELINPDNPAAPMQIGQCATSYNLPFFGEFLADVIERQSGENEAFGRRYQRETILRPGLGIVSPLSGSPVVSTQSMLVRGKIFYQFFEGIDYYVISSRIRFGYPLAALFVPQANCLLKWERGGSQSILPAHLCSLARLLERDEAGPHPIAGPPIVLIGHRNFAHHLWNELSALELFLSLGASVPPPELQITREPLGPVDAIFPELASWKIARLGDRASHSRLEPGRLFVNLGGYRISSTLRKRIVRHAITAATPQTSSLIAEIRALRAPVFWLSVRMQNPTFTNQKEILIAIATKLLDRYAKCCILFDGFSVPHDWQSTNDESARFYTEAGGATRNEIGRIIEAIMRGRTRAPSHRVANLGGLGILDTIALAQLADSYFCHAGTVQHKIGWTSNKPGIIHGSLKVLSEDPAEWHATRLEGGVKPCAIAPEMIEDVPSDGLRGNSRENNYRAVDCDALSSFAVDYFQRRIERTSA